MALQPSIKEALIPELKGKADHSEVLVGLVEGSAVHKAVLARTSISRTSSMLSAVVVEGVDHSAGTPSNRKKY